MPARKRKLTDADRRAAARVRELWADYKRRHPGVSQEAAAARAGFTQSAFSQFLLGRVPIRVSPAIKFAKLFGVQPSAIREDLGVVYETGTSSASAAREPSPDDLPADALEIARVFSQLQPQTKERMRELLFIFSVIDKQYPWLRRGRPKGESYDKFEQRAVQNWAAMVELAAARLKG